MKTTLTEQEYKEYKDILFSIRLVREYMKADFRLSYKRAKDNTLYYYLSVYMYEIDFQKDHAYKIYTKTFRRYNTYQKIMWYLLLTDELYRSEKDLFNIYDKLEAYK